MLHMRPEQPRRSGSQLCQSHSNANSCVEAKWRRGGPGGKPDKAGAEFREAASPCRFIVGTSQVYPSCSHYLPAGSPNGEDYRTALLFDSPQP